MRRRARRARREFTEELKAEAVTLVRTSGKTLQQVARDLDLTESSLRNWVERQQPRGPASSVSELEWQVGNPVSGQRSPHSFLASISSSESSAMTCSFLASLARRVAFSVSSCCSREE